MGKRWYYVFFVTTKNVQACTTLHCTEKDIENRLKKLIQIDDPEDQLVMIADWIEIPTVITAHLADDFDELDELEERYYLK